MKSRDVLANGRDRVEITVDGLPEISASVQELREAYEERWRRR